MDTLAILQYEQTKGLRDLAITKSMSVDVHFFLLDRTFIDWKLNSKIIHAGS